MAINFKLKSDKEIIEYLKEEYKLLVENFLYHKENPTGKENIKAANKWFEECINNKDYQVLYKGLELDVVELMDADIFPIIKNALDNIVSAGKELYDRQIQNNNQYMDKGANMGLFDNLFKSKNAKIDLEMQKLKELSLKFISTEELYNKLSRYEDSVFLDYSEIGKINDLNDNIFRIRDWVFSENYEGTISKSEVLVMIDNYISSNKLDKRGKRMNFVVEKNGKDYVFKRFIEALSFSQSVEKETSNKVAILQKEIEVNSKWDLEKGELIMNQNEVNNKGLVMPETSAEATTTKWITIPKSVIGKEFEYKDKNDKPHTYVFVNLPQDESSMESFSILAKQVQPHPFIKELCNIPISEYGINMCHSIKVEVAPLAQSGDTKIGPEYKWQRDDEINHLTQDEAVHHLTSIYKNINNRDTQYMLVPKEACKEINGEEAKNKGKINVIMPKYMQEHNGFNFAESNFIVNKVYHLAAENMKEMRAVQCSPNAKFRVYFNDGRFLDVAAKYLAGYNKDDYAKYKEQAKENGSNLEKEDTPNKFAEATAEIMNSDIEDTLEEDCAKIVEGMTQKEAAETENSTENANINEGVENEDEGNEIN